MKKEEYNGRIQCVYNDVKTVYACRPNSVREV